MNSRRLSAKEMSPNHQFSARTASICCTAKVQRRRCLPCQEEPCPLPATRSYVVQFTDAGEVVSLPTRRTAIEDLLRSRQPINGLAVVSALDTGIRFAPSAHGPGHDDRIYKAPRLTAACQAGAYGHPCGSSSRLIAVSDRPHPKNISAFQRGGTEYRSLICYS